MEKENQNLESILLALKEQNFSKDDQESINAILTKYRGIDNSKLTENLNLIPKLIDDTSFEDTNDWDALNHSDMDIDMDIHMDIDTPVVVNTTQKAKEISQSGLIHSDEQSIEWVDPEGMKSVAQYMGLDLDKTQANEVTNTIQPILKYSVIMPQEKPTKVKLNGDVVTKDNGNKDIPVVPTLEKQEFQSFKNISQNSLSRVSSLFKFKNANGKLDWFSKSVKTIIVLKNIKNMNFENKILNRFQKLFNKSSVGSKVGIQTTDNPETGEIVVNLLSKEEKYNKEFKNALNFLGYTAQELVNPNKISNLSLVDIQQNFQKTIKENLKLDANQGYTSNFMLELSSEDQLKFIQKIIWPKLIEMLGESVKLFEVLKDLKQKHPLYKEISQAVKKSNLEENLFMSLLLKSPNLLREQKIPGIEELLHKTTELENYYYKNEELSSKNFVVVQNLVKVGTMLQKLIINSDLPSNVKNQACLDMQKNVFSSVGSKKISFEIVQATIVSSLEDKKFVKSLTNVNQTIIEMRNKLKKEEHLNLRKTLKNH